MRAVFTGIFGVSIKACLGASRPHLRTFIAPGVGAATLLIVYALFNDSPRLKAQQDSEIPAAPPPRLELEVQGHEVTLWYPASASDYMLQSTDSLVPPIQWFMITENPVPRGDRLTVTLVETSPGRFYRLHKVDEITDSDHAAHHQ